MHDSQYMTNQLCGSSTRLQSPTREGCQLQSSSVHLDDEDQEDAWSQNPTMHKHSNLFTRTMNQGKTVSPITICLNKLCLTLVQLVSTLTALKIILLYVQGSVKRKSKHIITDQSQNRTENLFFLNIDKWLSVELLSSHGSRTTLQAQQMASCRALMTDTFQT